MTCWFRIKKACTPADDWDGEFPFTCKVCKYKIGGMGG